MKLDSYSTHKKAIQTESAGEGKGSTFQFTLPIHPPALPEPISAAAHITGKNV